MNNLHVGKWWHRDADSERIVCDLCPRQCSMKEGDRGFCFVRKIQDGQMVLDTYGKSTGFCVDPIEKKPLHHFYPGTSVLSFGTAGCNLGCQFCQNWDISKSREVAKLSSVAEPELIAQASKELGCKSVAFTYNDPVIWAEYAIDTARACRVQGIQSVAVTAGYISPEARRDFFVHMDAANVDLKSFSEEFYRKITYSHLEPVLETLRYLKHETDVWFEITNLVIPGSNDSRDELMRMCDWLLVHLGADVPIHFSAFHPDFRMLDKPRTPHETLLMAYELAKSAGLRYPYVGNVHDVEHGSTYCWNCSEMLIERDWYQLGRYGLLGDLCVACGSAQAGRFAEAPGDWGRKRQPVNLESFRQTKRRNTSDAVSWSILPNSKLPVSHVPDEESMPRPSITAPTKLEMLKLDELSVEQKHSIHRATQIVVIAATCGRGLSNLWIEILGPLAELHVMGLFTTLSRGNVLRGCCGFVGKPTKLRDAILTSAQRTATDDQRMPAISPSEIAYLTLDVSLLSAPIPMSVRAATRAEHVHVGQHGLKISRGDRSGLLLPSVPVEQKWTSEQFLQGVCRKAGLNENAWKEDDTLLETFEGVVIDGAIESLNLPTTMPVKQAPGDLNSLQRLKEVATQNMIAFSQGATPSYYALDAMDGNVQGIVLTIVDTSTKTPLAHWIKTSLRPGMALQSTLFELCASAAEMLKRARFNKATDVELAITVLFDPAQQGVIQFEDWEAGQLKSELSRCWMEGAHSGQRAILTTCGEYAAVAFDAEKSISQLLGEAAKAIKSRRNPIGVYSLGCISTASALLAFNASPNVDIDTPRKPSLSEGFYPLDPEARRAMVSQFKSQVPEDIEAIPAYALMTPHAGLRYSGQVAMDVWSSAKLPSTILMIGPKHTAFGQEWAVSPSKVWELPGNVHWEMDRELANRIVEKVEGMVFDLSAHAREHGIEIQLPILEGLTAPEERPKIVAIAMKGATLEEIDLVSEQLADVIRELPEWPLLVISSDMNHYQPEAENRRRDRLAVDAMLTGDPQRLIEVCQSNAISMCGLVPAAIVMKTLIHLGKPFRVEEVSYDNSGRLGDPNRVVGYAGVVFLPA